MPDVQEFCLEISPPCKLTQYHGRVFMLRRLTLLPLVIYVSKKQTNYPFLDGFTGHISWMSRCACNTWPLSPVEHNPHTHMNGCSGMAERRGEEGGWGEARVGGSGCDLDTVWHTAFLMGHFDHCHSLYACKPQTQRLSKHSNPNSAPLLFNDGSSDPGCGDASVGEKMWILKMLHKKTPHQLMCTSFFISLWLLLCTAF